MRLNWTIGERDIKKIKKLFNENSGTDFVRKRKARNVTARPKRIRRDKFWHAMVMCLMTTQQKASADSKVMTFMNRKPFPLSWKHCAASRNVHKLAKQALNGAASVAQVRLLLSLRVEAARNAALRPQSSRRKKPHLAQKRESVAGSK